MKDKIDINIKRGLGILFWILAYFYWYEWMERSSYCICKGIVNSGIITELKK